MCKELKFYLILEMDGEFPGSPDRTRFEISEEEYDRLIDERLKPIRSVRGGIDKESQEVKMIEMSPWEWRKWQDANWPKFMEQLNKCYKSDYCKIRDQGLATCRHPNVRSYGKECGPTNCFVCDNI